jgi:hypothetical protein
LRCYRILAFTSHQETKLDFAFLGAVGPVLALTSVIFFLAFIAEIDSKFGTLA